MNTDEELIQKAIELCKNNVARLVKTIAEEQAEIDSFKESRNSELLLASQVMQRELKPFQDDLNSWKAHLAEIENWKQFIEQDPKIIVRVFGWQVIKTFEDALLLKAKRLLGVK